MDIYLRKDAWEVREEIENMLARMALYDCDFGNRAYQILQSEHDYNYIENLDDDYLASRIWHKIEQLLEPAE